MDDGGDRSAYIGGEGAVEPTQAAHVPASTAPPPPACVLRALVLVQRGHAHPPGAGSRMHGGHPLLNGRSKGRNVVPRPGTGGTRLSRARDNPDLSLPPPVDQTSGGADAWRENHRYGGKAPRAGRPTAPAGWRDAWRENHRYGKRRYARRPAAPGPPASLADAGAKPPIRWARRHARGAGRRIASPSPRRAVGEQGGRVPGGTRQPGARGAARAGLEADAGFKPPPKRAISAAAASILDITAASKLPALMGV